MTARTRTVAAAAAAVLVGATVTGCELLSHLPAPPPDPPKATAATTPTETAQERTMRLDKEAAEKAYQVTAAEGARLAMLGGASSPTKILTDNTTGAYLDVRMTGLRTLKSKGWRTDRPGETSVIANGGWSPNEIGLTACEDSSKVRLLDQSGKEVNEDRRRRFIQTLTAKKVDGRWKIADVDSKIVKSFENEGCNP